jgi:hypothetical protein
MKWKIFTIITLLFPFIPLPFVLEEGYYLGGIVWFGVSLLGDYLVWGEILKKAWEEDSR